MSLGQPPQPFGGGSVGLGTPGHPNADPKIPTGLQALGICFVIYGVMVLLATPIGILGNVLNAPGSVGTGPVAQGEEVGYWIGTGFVGLFGVAMAILGVVAGLKMRKAKGHGLAVAASIAA
ncbi:MAG: hypothetical protein AAGF12_39205, partial [Myxococcota bacterium]